MATRFGLSLRGAWLADPGPQKRSRRRAKRLGLLAAAAAVLTALLLFLVGLVLRREGPPGETPWSNEEVIHGTLSCAEGSHFVPGDPPHCEGEP